MIPFALAAAQNLKCEAQNPWFEKHMSQNYLQGVRDRTHTKNVARISKYLNC